MAELASAQALWPALFLLLGGISKLIELRRGADGMSLVAVLGTKLGSPQASAATLAVIELGLAGALLGGLAYPLASAGAACFFALAAVVIGAARNLRPNAPCGCFGSISSSRPSWQGIGRSLLLSAAATASALSGAAFTVEASLLMITVLGVGAVALLWLSPELRIEGLRSLVLGARCRVARVLPMLSRRAKIENSGIWKRAHPHLKSQVPAESWRAGCWRFFCYPAIYGGAATTAVFALYGPTPRHDRVSFVDERSGMVLGVLFHRDDELLERASAPATADESRQGN